MVGGGWRGQTSRMIWPGQPVGSSQVTTDHQMPGCSSADDEHDQLTVQLTCDFKIVSHDFFFEVLH